MFFLVTTTMQPWVRVFFSLLLIPSQVFAFSKNEFSLSLYVCVANINFVRLVCVCSFSSLFGIVYNMVYNTEVFFYVIFMLK